MGARLDFDVGACAALSGEAWKAIRSRGIVLTYGSVACDSAGETGAGSLSPPFVWRDLHIYTLSSAYHLLFLTAQWSPYSRETLLWSFTVTAGQGHCDISLLSTFNGLPSLKGCCPSYSSTHLNWFIDLISSSSSFSDEGRLFPIQMQVDL